MPDFVTWLTSVFLRTDTRFIDFDISCGTLVVFSVIQGSSSMSEIDQWVINIWVGG